MPQLFSQCRIWVYLIGTRSKEPSKPSKGGFEGFEGDQGSRVSGILNELKQPAGPAPGNSAVDKAAEYHRRRIAAKEAGLACQGLGPDGITPIAEYQRLAAEGVKEAAAEAFLISELATGSKTAKAIRDAAEGAGHAWRTVERAKAAIGIAATKRGEDGAWYWALPEDRQAEDRQGIRLKTANTFPEDRQLPPVPLPAPIDGPWPEPALRPILHFAFGAVEVPHRYRRAWRELLARCPDGLSERQWAQAIYDARDLFETWGAKIEEMRWADDDIFERPDGLIWFL